MTDVDVGLADLQEIQRTLHQTPVSKFNAEDNVFLLSLKQGNPNWDNLGIGDYSKLPGVQ